ncbi:MAG TPA: hypothetical protein VK586_20975 [Streptosporangiaceae bacterium]|nr:hypothetical protein [Streptosporangiaceae bacterium]
MRTSPDTQTNPPATLTSETGKAGPRRAAPATLADPADSRMRQSRNGPVPPARRATSS